MWGSGREVLRPPARGVRTCHGACRELSVCSCHLSFSLFTHIPDGSMGDLSAMRHGGVRRFGVRLLPGPPEILGESPMGTVRFPEGTW